MKREKEEKDGVHDSRKPEYDDVLYIHNRVNKYFNDEKENIFDYEKLIKRILTDLRSVDIPYGLSQKLLQDFDLLKNIYSDTLKGKRIKESFTYKEFSDLISFCKELYTHISLLQDKFEDYDVLTSTHVQEYTRLMNEPTNMSFIGKKIKDTSEMDKIVDDYHNTLKTLIKNKKIFFEIVVPDPYKDKLKKSSLIKNNNSIWNPKNIKQSVKKTKTIKLCDCPKGGDDFIENNQLVCGVCGTVYNTSCSENITFHDYSRVNFNQKYHYEKILHFRDTINQYQGKQNKNIPEEVYKSLEDMLEKHGLVNVNETDKLKRYERVTKEHIRMFLAENKHVNFYEDKELIFSKITGKPKPDISKYEKQLYEDFDKLAKIFVTLDNVKRKNFLNNHYVLRQLLLRQGVKVKENELNTLKTASRIREHDEIYQRCCEKLGWNFVPMS